MPVRPIGENQVYFSDMYGLGEMFFDPECAEDGEITDVCFSRRKGDYMETTTYDPDQVKANRIGLSVQIEHEMGGSSTLLYTHHTIDAMLEAVGITPQTIGEMIGRKVVTHGGTNQVCAFNFKE